MRMMKMSEICIRLNKQLSIVRIDQSAPVTVSVIIDCRSQGPRTTEGLLGDEQAEWQANRLML